MNKFIPLSSLKDTTGSESTNKPFPIIRNGYDELYVMSYKEYLRRKAIIMLVKKTF